MVRNANDVPGLKILNSNSEVNSAANSSGSGQNFSNNVFAGNTQKSKQVASHGKGNMTSSSSLPNNSR